MTAYSPYQDYPGPVPAAATQPSPVFVAVADPGRQRRLTVFFRWIMLIPHVFVLYFVGLAAAVIAFIGWWGALFTGRLPEFAVSFLSGWLRWSTRVNAYRFLLTDAYPPFALDDDPAYPVRMAIPAPQRLNRAAVFFRGLLAIPAAIIASVVIFGATTLLGFVAWLITLVTGQLPSAFHLAYVAVLRFQARYTAYYYLLTPAYPGGLYGDKVGTVSWADDPRSPQAPGFGTPGVAYGAQWPASGNPAGSTPQGSGTPLGYGAPEGHGGQPGDDAPHEPDVTPGSADPAQGYAGSPGYGAPQGYGAPEGYGVPAPGYGVPASYGTPGGHWVRPVFQPVTWLLRLTSGARNLVTAFIVLGTVSLVILIALYAVLVSSVSNTVSNAATAANAINQVNNSYATLLNTVTTIESATNCDQNLTCVTRQDTKAVTAFNMFSSQLAATAVPASAAAAKAKLSADADAAARDFTELSQSTTPAQYQSTISASGFLRTLNTFDIDTRALIKALQQFG